MNATLESVVNSVGLPQALSKLVDEIIEALADRNIELLSMDAQKSINGISDLLFLRFLDHGLNTKLFISVNDKDKTVSFGETGSCHSNPICYADQHEKLVALAVAYTATETVASWHKKEFESKYKTTRYITRSAFEGMNHDTLIGALGEFLRVVTDMQGKDEHSVCLESWKRNNNLNIVYTPQTHTLTIDGAASLAVNAVIRLKTAKFDDTMTVFFN